MAAFRVILFAITACGIAACSGPTPPSAFSPAVKTDSGLAATGSAGPAGGAGAPANGTGNVATVPAR